MPRVKRGLFITSPYHVANATQARLAGVLMIGHVSTQHLSRELQRAIYQLIAAAVNAAQRSAALPSSENTKTRMHERCWRPWPSKKTKRHASACHPSSSPQKKNSTCGVPRPAKAHLKRKTVLEVCHALLECGFVNLGLYVECMWLSFHLISFYFISSLDCMAL